VIVRTVGIVGAGTMGQGIAVACAAAGLDVLVSERTPQSAQAALAEIVQGLDHDIAKWRRTESEKRNASSNTTPTWRRSESSVRSRTSWPSTVMRPAATS